MNPGLPRWFNTLDVKGSVGHIDRMQEMARNVGYPFFVWNDGIFLTDAKYSTGWVVQGEEIVAPTEDQRSSLLNFAIKRAYETLDRGTTMPLEVFVTKVSKLLVFAPREEESIKGAIRAAVRRMEAIPKPESIYHA